MQGTLNRFQRSMLQWNDPHPYSAVHVAQVPGPVDAPRLRMCLNSILETRGLNRLTIDRVHCAYQYRGGPADCELRTLASGDDPDPRPALVAELERQLNLPFAHAGEFNPFRFILAPAADSFYLGLVYFHPAADAESVVLLLKDIVSCYLAEGPAAPEAIPDLYPDGRSHLLRRYPRVVARRLLSFPAQILGFRRSHRARYRDAGEMDNGFALFSLTPADLGLVVGLGKSWGVTVNDVFLALLLKALSPLASARLKARKRRKLSVGCIVNIRRDLGVDSRRTFGLFLGSFTVSHEVPEGIGLRQLAGDLRTQTDAIKRRQLYLGTPLELGLADFLLKMFSPERRRKFYPKNYPLWGGITNMNLNSLWEPGAGRAPVDYFRGVSTGPVTPLVLSVTTVGNRANIGLSYRRTVFLPAEIDAVRSQFLSPLRELEEGH